MQLKMSSEEYCLIGAQCLVWKHIRHMLLGSRAFSVRFFLLIVVHMSAIMSCVRELIQLEQLVCNEVDTWDFRSLLHRCLFVMAAIMTCWEVLPGQGKGLAGGDPGEGQIR